MAFVLLTGLLYGPHLVGVVTDGSWLAGTFLLGPAIGLASVVAGVIVSARVNDPRTAQQIGGIVIVPLVGIAVVQASGTILFGAIGYTITAAVVLLVDQCHRPARRRRPLRPRDDPHPLALGRDRRLAAAGRRARGARASCGGARTSARPRRSGPTTQRLTSRERPPRSARGRRGDQGSGPRPGSRPIETRSHDGGER